jgi:hypothetical protein
MDVFVIQRVPFPSLPTPHHIVTQKIYSHVTLAPDDCCPPDSDATQGHHMSDSIATHHVSDATATLRQLPFDINGCHPLTAAPRCYLRPMTPPPPATTPRPPQPTAPLCLWCVAPSARSVVPLRTRLVASTLAIGELSGVQQRGVEMRGGKKWKSKKNAKKSFESNFKFIMSELNLKLIWMVMNDNLNY